MWSLSWSLWDRVPWPGVESRPPGPPWSPMYLCSFPSRMVVSFTREKWRAAVNTDTPCFPGPHSIMRYRHCIFFFLNKLKVCGNSALSKSIGAIFSTAVAPFISSWHILVILTIGLKRSVFIPIPKKGNAKECSNYCAVVLISAASKVMLKILQARLHPYVSWEFPDVQAGFTKGRGTKDQFATFLGS